MFLLVIGFLVTVVTTSFVFVCTARCSTHLIFTYTVCTIYYPTRMQLDPKTIHTIILKTCSQNGRYPIWGQVVSAISAIWYMGIYGIYLAKTSRCYKQVINIAWKLVSIIEKINQILICLKMGEFFWGSLNVFSVKNF